MTVDSNQLTYILENTPATQNIMLVGKHGIGKSRILEEYFASTGQKVVTLFLGQMSDPGDLIGLPHLDEITGRTEFMLPYWFPVDGKPIVLFLDELNRARPEVLQTVMDLTLNRKLAGKALPPGSRIISAVNGGSEYQLTDLDPALVSRFNIYEFAPSVNDWLLWAEKSGIDSRITSFITENPEYLDSDTAGIENGGLSRTPDRRSWESVSEIIKNFDSLSEKQLPLISGIIGNQASSLFFRFVNEKSVPSAKTVLSAGKDFFSENSRLSALNPAQICSVNESLFCYIEGESWKNDEEEFVKKIACNFELYFIFIDENCPKETSAHFISLCSANRFPNTLNFILEKCPSLYKKLLDEAVNL